MASVPLIGNKEVHRVSTIDHAVAFPARFDLNRKALVKGGIQAVETSNAPLIAMARRIDPHYRENRDWYQDNIEAVASRRPEKRSTTPLPLISSPPTTSRAAIPEAR